MLYNDIFSTQLNMLTLNDWSGFFYLVPSFSFTFSFWYVKEGIVRTHVWALSLFTSLFPFSPLSSFIFFRFHSLSSWSAGWLVEGADGLIYDKLQGNERSLGKCEIFCVLIFSIHQGVSGALLSMQVHHMKRTITSKGSMVLTSIYIFLLKYVRVAVEQKTDHYKQSKNLKKAFSKEILQ